MCWASAKLGFRSRARSKLAAASSSLPSSARAVPDPVRLRTVRLDCNRPFIAGDGVGTLALFLEEPGAVEESLGEIGLEAQGLLEAGGGLVEPSLLGAHRAKAIIALRKVRFKR